MDVSIRSREMEGIDNSIWKREMSNDKNREVIKQDINLPMTQTFNIQHT